MPERDYTNDYEDWLRTQPPWEQGKPEPPQGSVAPPMSVAPPTAPPAPTPTTSGRPRDPRAGPPGSTEPNLDPPGYRGGYWGDDGQWVQGSPYNPGDTGGDGPIDFGGLERPDFNSWNWPVFTPPSAPNIEPFVFNTFEAPSLEEAMNEPGYAFARDQGRKMLENSAAARGLLRSGGTLKDILEYGNQFAEQNYGNVFNRKRDIFNTNEGNRFQAAGFNRDSLFGAFDRNYRGAYDAHRSQFDASKAGFDATLADWLKRVDATIAASRPPD